VGGAPYFPPTERVRPLAGRDACLPVESLGADIEVPATGTDLADSK
jgi:hypothetical protein